MPRSKKQLKVLQKFTAGIMQALQERDIEMSVRHEIDPANVENGFSAEGKAMTKFGQLDIHVYTTWVHTCFELPDLAAKGGLSCNPHSGKWNFHYHNNDFGKDPAYMADCILDFAQSLDRVEATTWTLSHSEISAEEAGSHSKNYWERRRGMGEAFSIEGQNSVMIAEFLADNWTDNDGNIPDWFRSSSQSYLSRCDDIDLFFHIQNFSKKNDIDLSQFLEVTPSVQPA